MSKVDRDSNHISVDITRYEHTLLRDISTVFSSCILLLIFSTLLNDGNAINNKAILQDPIVISRMDIAPIPFVTEVFTEPQNTEQPEKIPASAPQSKKKEELPIKNTKVKKIPSPSSHSTEVKRASSSDYQSNASKTSHEEYLIPSIEAQLLEQVKPEIPVGARDKEYKSYVRVKLEVQADGTSIPTLKTSSGNELMDKEVLKALKQWKWAPALLNGKAVKSVRYFKFEIEVR